MHVDWYKLSFNCFNYISARSFTRDAFICLQFLSNMLLILFRGTTQVERLANNAHLSKSMRRSISFFSSLSVSECFRGSTCTHLKIFWRHFFSLTLPVLFTAITIKLVKQCDIGMSMSTSKFVRVVIKKNGTWIVLSIFL